MPEVGKKAGNCELCWYHSEEENVSLDVQFQTDCLRLGSLRADPETGIWVYVTYWSGLRQEVREAG